MSQAKVDRYKNQKANRKEIMKKEKRERIAWKIGGYAVAIVLVGWIGFSVYDRYHVETVKTYELNNQAVEEYIGSVGDEGEF